MDFESPDVEKDFPGLYASESGKKSNESDFSDEAHERISKKDLLIGKRKDKKDSKKDLRYATLEGESSPEEDADVKSPSKSKKLKPFKFPTTKKEKREKSREKDGKDKEIEKEKEKKKDVDKDKKKEIRVKLKLKEKKKGKHSEENCDIGEEHPIFGVPLSVAVERNRCHDGVEIPLVVRDCIDLVQEIGLNVEGIYKVSGIKSRVQTVRRLYNQREPVILADYDLPVATSLLKMFLRELPEPILTTELIGRFEEVGAIKDVSSREVEMKILIEKLPRCNRELLTWIVKHLDHVTSHEKYNKMNAQTLAITLSPVLQTSQRLLSALLCHCDAIFPGTKLTKYIPPLSCGSPSLPDTAAGITDELRKQESLLEQIHCEMNAGLVTKNREEQLWEVQRIITQLKRNLRSLERAVESSQRSIEEPDSVRLPEEELNLGLQQSTSSETSIPPPPSQPPKPNEHIVEVVVERADVTSTSSEKINEIQNSEQLLEEPRSSQREEMALCLETEELTSLATSLQAMIENEKVEISRLKNKIRALGGNPVYNGAPMDMTEDLNDDTNNNELKNEALLLQFQKESLIQTIMEEREACANLRVQIKLAQMSVS